MLRLITIIITTSEMWLRHSMCENDFKDVVDSEFNTSYIECDTVATVFSYLL